jgi:hypothetical protein
MLGAGAPGHHLTLHHDSSWHDQEMDSFARLIAYISREILRKAFRIENREEISEGQHRHCETVPISQISTKIMEIYTDLSL